MYVTATTETIRGRPRVRLNEAYVNALVSAGLIPLILPPVSAALATGALSNAAGLVLTGGEDIDPALFGETAHPATGPANKDRDEYELALAREACSRRLPTLAICRGAQVMNVALGGSLIQDIPSQRPTGIEHDASARRTERVHPVHVVPGSRLEKTIGSVVATNSSHHQSVGRVAGPLRVTATSPDGIVEALEPIDASWHMMAVQWHPEELTATPEDWDRRLFAAFADAVRGGGRD